MQQVLAIAGSVVIFVAYIIYIWSILTGKTKPHRMTRFVLLIITALGLASLIAQHDQAAVWLIGVCAVMSAVIFLFSLKYGMGGWEKTDLICLGIATLGIVIWRITDDPALGLYASVTADFVGMVPALLKTHKHPHTEYWLSYVFDIVAAGLTLAAITEWEVQAFLYPLYIVGVNLVMLTCIFQPHRKRARNTRAELVPSVD